MIFPCHPHGITGYGSDQAKLMIIGMAPARDEMQSRRPFSGPSGKLLDGLLKDIGLTREEVYTTNLICWRPEYDHILPEHIPPCAMRLREEIRFIQPRLILALGQLVSDTFYPKRANLRGSPVQLSNKRTYFMHTYHPAAVLHAQDDPDKALLFANTLVQDFRKIPGILSGPQGPDIVFDYCYSLESAQAVLDNLPDGSSLDIECGSDKNDPEKSNRILCFSVSNGSRVWVISGEHVKNLIWPDIGFTTHNGLYDARVLLKLGIHIHIAEDSLLQSYSLNELPGFHDLKQVSRSILGVGFYEDAMHPYKKDFAQAPIKVLHEYNAQDARYTKKISVLLRIKQESDGVRDFYTNILIPAANAFVEIQNRGILVDKKELELLAREWLPRLQSIKAKLDFYGINLDSPKQVSDLLYNKLRLPGGPSTDKANLEVIRHLHDFPRQLLEYRQLEKFIKTYILGIYDDIRSDGCVHALVSLHGTTTGRLSYKDPPLQTIPGEDSRGGGEDFGRIKKLFIARPGYVLCSADYNKAEIYVAAAHSQDSNLLHDVRTQDIHRVAASLIYDKPQDHITNQERSNAKNFVFGVFYGLNDYGAAYRFGITIEQAQEWMHNFFSRYAAFADWRIAQKQKIVCDGEVSTFFGRKRRFPLLIGNHMRSRAWRQAINDPIQADANDNTTLSLISLHAALKELDSYVLLHVHDELVFEINKNFLGEAIELIKIEMQRSKHPKMPIIPVSIKVSNSWGGM